MDQQGIPYLDDQLAEPDMVVPKPLGYGQVRHLSARAMEELDDIAVQSRAGNIFHARISALYRRAAGYHSKEIDLAAHCDGAEGAAVYPRLDIHTHDAE